MNPYEQMGEEQKNKAALMQSLAGTQKQALTQSLAQPNVGAGAPIPGTGGATGGIVPPKAADPYTAKGPAMGLEGFDAGKLADTKHVDPKYVFARAAQGLGMGDQDELLRRLKADPNGYFANASFGGSKGDKLTIGGQLDPSFNGIGSFDVVRGAGNGGEGWQWAPDGPNAAQGGSGGGRGGFTGGSMANGGMTDDMAKMLTGDSYYKKLLAKLQNQAVGPDQSDTQALQSLLQSGGQ